MAAIKRRLKVPKDVESVHTAVVAGYFVEFCGFYFGCLVHTSVCGAR